MDSVQVFTPHLIGILSLLTVLNDAYGGSEGVIPSARLISVPSLEQLRSLALFLGHQRIALTFAATMVKYDSRPPRRYHLDAGPIWSSVRRSSRPRSCWSRVPV